MQTGKERFTARICSVEENRYVDGEESDNSRALQQRLDFWREDRSEDIKRKKSDDDPPFHRL